MSGEPVGDEVTHSGHPDREHRIEVAVGNLLRIGVLTSALVALVGGVIFLCQHGGERADYHHFHLASSSVTTFGGILGALGSGQGQVWVQLGVILLVATPIARVILTVGAFAILRDRLYVVISLIVLGLLLYSLLGPGV